MTVVTTRPPEEMTLAELKARAKELGIESSQVEPIEATGEVPVKADWLREVPSLPTYVRHRARKELE